MGELVGVRLAERDGSGGLEALGSGGVERRNVVLIPQNIARRRARHAFLAVVVLGEIGDSREGIAEFPFLIDLLGFLQGLSRSSGARWR